MAKAEEIILIRCPACDKGVSNKANSCPHCGHPLKNSTGVYINNAKRGKGKKLVGLLLFILSIMMFTAGYSDPTNTLLPTLGALLLVVGIALLIYGKIEHWWHWK